MLMNAPLPLLLFLAPLAGPPASLSPYELLPRAEEIALARSAGLAPWSESATVYVLTANGYVKAEEGTNGFTCLVGRDHPGTLWPICFDAEGTRAIVPRILKEVALRQKGASREEVEKDSAARFLSGEYEAPSHPGIAYMLSPEALTHDGRNLIQAEPAEPDETVEVDLDGLFEARLAIVRDAPLEDGRSSALHRSFFDDLTRAEER